MRTPSEIAESVYDLNQTEATGLVEAARLGMIEALRWARWQPGLTFDLFDQIEARIRELESMNPEVPEPIRSVTDEQPTDQK